MGMAVFSGVSTLGPADVRVLGSLLEKQRTTPDAYPLSLNALRLACNQSTNRDPVMQLDERVVSNTLENLKSAGVVRVVYSKGMRVDKYRHVLPEAIGVTKTSRHSKRRCSFRVSAPGKSPASVRIWKPLHTPST